MSAIRLDVERILCPVDFSEFSSRALEFAVRLAPSLDARVDVLHVLEPSIAGADGTAAGDASRRKAEEALARLTAPFRNSGVPLETRVLEGEPWRVIVGEAGALPADLAVIGTHGSGGLERLLLGSVTEKVLRRAPCPVLTIGRGAPAATGPLFRRILCAVDLTEGSPDTMGTALFLAQGNVAPITLLHVIETLSDKSQPAFYREFPELAPLLPALMARARAALAGMVPAATRRLCTVSERVEVGTAWDVILRVSREVEADLIVMGAHTLGSLSRFLFGSTASQVVRGADCPVLVIRQRIPLRPTAEREAAALTEKP